MVEIISRTGIGVLHGFTHNAEEAASRHIGFINHPCQRRKDKKNAHQD